jgi:hypothetical protein
MDWMGPWQGPMVAAKAVVLARRRDMAPHTGRSELLAGAWQMRGHEAQIASTCSRILLSAKILQLGPMTCAAGQLWGQDGQE